MIVDVRDGADVVGKFELSLVDKSSQRVVARVNDKYYFADVSYRTVATDGRIFYKYSDKWGTHTIDSTNYRLYSYVEVKENEEGEH